MDEIAFGDNANQLPGRVDHRKSADVMLQHGFCRVQNRGLRSNGDDGPGHDLMSAHLGLRSFGICPSKPMLGGSGRFDSSQESEHVFHPLIQLNAAPSLQSYSSSKGQKRR